MLFESGHEVGVEAGQQLDQGLASLGRTGMDKKVALGRAADLRPIRTEPEFGRDANGLAVGVHEHPTGEDIHDTLYDVCPEED